MPRKKTTDNLPLTLTGTKKAERAIRYTIGVVLFLIAGAGLVIAAVVTQREAWDLYLGRQTVAKTIVDQLSWFAIAGAGCWGLYRLVKKMGGRQ